MAAQVPGLNQLSLSGIAEGEIIEAQHVSQSVQALTGQEPYQVTITGSLEVSGSLRTSGSVVFKYVQETAGDANTLPGVLIDPSTGELFRGVVGGSVGEKGAQGPDGEKGETGAGTKGEKGDKGQKGQQGEIGVGTKGEKGAQGTIGEKGADSTVAGEKGAQGPDGEKGAQGTIGEKGADSTVAGEKGAQGATGEKGEGATGEKGAQGTIGEKGADSTVAGEKGAQGPDGEKGAQGATGTGEKGAQGPDGEKGAQGATGTGEKGAQGATGTGEKGAQGADGLAATVDVGTTTTGTANVVNSGTTSAAIFDFTVPQGEKGEAGAGGGSDTVINGQVRYIAYSVGTQEAQILSTGTVFGNKTWNRVASTVTVTSTAHGLTAGDFIVVRGGSDTYLYVEISNVSTNAFDFTSGTSGNASGSDLSYIPAAKLTTVSEAGATLEVPSAGNIQINSMAISTGQKTSSEFILTCPDDIENGSGDNTSLIGQNIPMVGVYKLSDGGFNPNGTISINSSSPFNAFTVGGINTFVNNMIRFQF
jgi:hypothetical protein